jgi:5-methylcytosine-specific restriction endonuclease McrA
MKNNLWKPSDEENKQLLRLSRVTVKLSKNNDKKAKRKAALREKRKIKQLAKKARQEVKYIQAIKSKVIKKKYSHPELGTDNYAKFYSSKAWKQLRYLALVNSEGKCCCCGAGREDGAILHVDHIKPRSRYPELELSLDNLQILCMECNIGKGDWDDTSWKDHFKSI